MKTMHEMFNESFSKPPHETCGGQDGLNEGGKERCAESVMDFPQGETLSDDVWDMVDGKWVMKPEAKEMARRFADWATGKFSLSSPKVRIVGSMCSNTYDDDADIDVHLTDTSLSEDDCKRINKELRRAFRDEFGEDGSDMLGTHPFEVFVQNNPYRDLMSVGCYDLDMDTWETEPLIRPADYDPYSTNYQAIYSQNSEIILRIRDFISSLQEFVCTVRLSERSGEEFRETLSSMSEGMVESAEALLEDAREMRGSIIDPDSEQEARMARESRMWSVSDATFKLLSKFGYISVLKKVSDIDYASDLQSFADAITVICGEKLYPQMFENVPAESPVVTPETDVDDEDGDDAEENEPDDDEGSPVGTDSEETEQLGDSVEQAEEIRKPTKEDDISTVAKKGKTRGKTQSESDAGKPKRKSRAKKTSENGEVRSGGKNVKRVKADGDGK